MSPKIVPKIGGSRLEGPSNTSLEEDEEEAITAGVARSYSTADVDCARTARILVLGPGSESVSGADHVKGPSFRNY